MSKAKPKSSPKARPAPAAKKVARAVRFKPDPGTMVGLAFQIKDQKALVVYGLALNESSTGFAAVILTDRDVKPGTPCLCRVGRLPLTNATVRWVKELEKNILKVGLEYT